MTLYQTYMYPCIMQYAVYSTQYTDRIQTAYQEHQDLRSCSVLLCEDIHTCYDMLCLLCEDIHTCYDMLCSLYASGTLHSVSRGTAIQGFVCQSLYKLLLLLLRQAGRGGEGGVEGWRGVGSGGGERGGGRAVSSLLRTLYCSVLHNLVHAFSTKGCDTVAE